MFETVLSLLSAHAPVQVLGRGDGEHPFVWISVGPKTAATKRVLFCCHVDAVPVGDRSHWTHDPWSADIDESGHMFGRGVCDMKGGLTAAIAAAIEISARDHSVELLLTSDEESGSLGAAAARDALSQADVPAGVIVCEPTAGTVVRGHRGTLWLKIHTAGRAAHGSTPERGVNAALLLIEALGRAHASHPRHTDPFLGEDTWNLGVFRAGDENPNIVPASAFATIDYRLVGHTEDELRNWWMSQPGVAHVETVLSLPAVHTPADDPWVGTLPAPLSAEPCSYFTDGSVLTGLWPRTPIVVWGPGAPQQMHADNEQIAVSEVEGIVEAYVTAAVQTEASGN